MEKKEIETGVMIAMFIFLVLFAIDDGKTLEKLVSKISK